jgi:hypothetical protein
MIIFNKFVNYLRQFSPDEQLFPLFAIIAPNLAKLVESVRIA